MRLILICLWTAGLIAAAEAGRADAEEMDFLQTDPRFTGGEFNPTNPTHPNFWFYDQYSAARAAIQAAGVDLVPVTTLTLANMTADSDCFYMPPPTDPTASTYPLTSSEITAIQQYVATGRSMIFNLGDGTSAAMDNDLLKRLGLTGIQASGDTSGFTLYPMRGQPILYGADGDVGSFDLIGSGEMSSLGKMRSLVNIGASSVIPYVEKGDLGYGQGAYFFILDDNFLVGWSSLSTSAQALFINMVEYAAQPQYRHYIAPSVVAVPEPDAAVALVAAGGVGLMMRRRTPRRRSAEHLANNFPAKGMPSIKYRLASRRGS
jgi:hypothetical protein